MTMIDTLGSGWSPAPGSVARRYWPLPVRWAWWLAHRPHLVALIALAVLVGVEFDPVAVPVAAGAVGVLLVVWWRAHPASFHPSGGRTLLGVWRSFWAYGSGGGPR